MSDDEESKTWEEIYDDYDDDEIKEEQSRLVGIMKNAKDDKRAFNSGSRSLVKSTEKKLNYLVDRLEEMNGETGE